jgi:DNA-binding CsgD family transcriptional regulator
VTHENEIPAGPQGSLETEIAEAEEALCDAVRESSLCVAVFDLSASRVLALSASAYGRLGLTGVDLASFDFVESASDPEAVRRLVALISSGHLEEWTFRSLLPKPDGGHALGYATGRLVGGLGSRLICLARYDWRSSRSEHGNPGNRLLEPAPEEILDEVRREERRLAARVAGLEGHLDRIGQEVGAAGLMTIVSALPPSSAVPGLAELSGRQIEVVTRLLRGQRVLTIARGMFLSPSTVRNHLSTIYRKVGVGSQAELLDLLQRARDADGSTQARDDAPMH